MLGEDMLAMAVTITTPVSNLARASADSTRLSLSLTLARKSSKKKEKSRSKIRIRYGVVTWQHHSNLATPTSQAATPPKWPPWIA